MSQVKLIAVDLDGTLLGDNNDISNENYDAINEAAEAGISTVIATGRNYSEIPLKVLELPIRYFITSNGSYVYDRREDKVAYSKCLALEQASYILNKGKKHGAYSMFYIGKNVYTSSDFIDYIKTLPEDNVYDKLAAEYMLCDDIATEPGADLYTQKVVLFFKEKADGQKLLEEMDQKDNRRAEFETSSSYNNNIEFNPRGVSKATGLQRIMNIMGINENNIAAIGDSSNDIAMLKFAVYSHAVENACPEVRACVPSGHIVPSNTDNGVAYMIEKLLQIKYQ